MAKYINIRNNFRVANIALANVWRNEGAGWSDSKGKRFGEMVLTPISNECREIDSVLEQMDKILSELVEKKLISEK